MVFLLKQIYFSRIFLVIIITTHILFYFLGNNIVYNQLALNPHLVIYEIQIWRLVSYPILPLSIAEAFLFIYSFWALGPKVENCFKKNYYPISLFVFIFLQGLLTTALFGKENFYLLGTEGLSFYLITLYYLTYFRIVSQYESLPLRNMVQTALVVFFWLMAATLDSFIYERNILINSFSFAIVGIFVGTFSYLQNRSFAIELIQQRYRDFVSFKKKLEELENSNIQDVEHSLIKTETSSILVDSHPMKQNLTEENLNRILDKILENGIESLTDEEIKFLKEYSKKINK